MKLNIIALLFAVALFTTCQNKPEDDIVSIMTPYGEIKVKLYPKTVHHHDNFLALAENGFYNNTLFHRVIDKFVIQGGDPLSRHADIGQLLGEGDTTYKLPFEYVAEYMHKRGALAAARDMDLDNPDKESSGCQFYIVQGKRYTDGELSMIEARHEQQDKARILLEILKRQPDTTLTTKFRGYIKARDTANISGVLQKFKSLVDLEYAQRVPWKLTDEQREIYRTIGGTPQLDGGYTVFGEVISGMEVVDKIASEPCDANDRPQKDIRMTMKVIHKAKK